MSQHFDIAVLGSGPGGYVAALKAAQMGARTAIVEQHPFFGGTCLNWGCIPSKTLLASSLLIEEIRHASELGIEVSGSVKADWGKIQKRKDKVLRNLRGGIKSLFKARDVKTFHGLGVLDGPGKIVINQDGKKISGLTADKIILAVGSVPARIPGWPENPERVCTSDEALHWEELPKSVLIVGGGIIGCEFACMMAPLGVEVTIVEMMPKLMPMMDEHLADEMAKEFKKRKLPCYTDTRVEEIKETEKGIEARLSSGKTIQAEKVLVATGRKPNTAGLGLETVGIEQERGFIRVNDRMETTAQNYYCIGDANGRSMLAHAASAQGVAAVENAMGHDKPFDAPIPSCVFTSPEMAAVGMTQQEACQAKIPVSIGVFPIGHLGKAMAVGDTDGFVKVIRHRENGMLLGVHMVGHNVTEVIAAAGAVLHQKVEVRQLAETVFAHPTISEALKEAAEDSLGMAVHLPPRKVIRVSA
jgi:dihydrolipoamide dehydrogenase